MFDQDLKDIEAALVEARGDLATATESFEEKVAKIREDGKTLATIDDDQAADLAADRKAIDEKKAHVQSLTDRSKLVMDSMARVEVAKDKGNGSGKRMSYAEMVLSSPDYAALTPDRLAGRSAIGAMPNVDVLDRDALVANLGHGRIFGTATALLDAGIPLDERLYPPVDIRRRPLALLDLISVGATNTDTVKYARQTTRTSAAAETALGTGYSEASFDFEQVIANVESIGHFTTAYRENIADAAQFDTLIRSQLEQDVMLRLESQILSGLGTGSELEGILNTDNVQSFDHDATNDRRVVSVHKAMTLVRTGAFREPNAVLMHPNDFQEMLFEEIALSSATGALFAANLRDGTPANVWGVPIVVSTVAVEGTAVVGYWPDATLWVRSGVSLAVSDSHSDYFVRRQVAILAEMRGAFSVQRPASFCEITTI